MFYTYILESLNHPDRHYVGHTSDLKVRLKEHNSGRSPHTATHRPWKVRCYFAFETESLARNFETYLKTGSGRTFNPPTLRRVASSRAFATKRLW